MAKILDIKKYPEEVLINKCKPVKIVDDDVRELLSDMIFTMHATNGIGLAAPQVGIDKQIAVVDIGEGPISLINPVITKRRGSSSIEEGCLSLTGVNVKVKRSSAITVEALDEAGAKICIDAEGLLATVIQHETDHLNGILIMDHANFLKKKIIKSRLTKEQSGNNNAKGAM